jgi:tetratricopeptide (TPR) repeat protein
MDVPPDIRRPSRRQTLSDMMCSIRHMRASKLSESGRDLISKKEWEAALADLKEAQSFYEELHDELEVSNMLSLQGLCQFALGQLEDASASMLIAVGTKTELGALEGKATDLLGLGEVRLKMRDGNGALAAFNEARDIFDQLDLIEAKASAEHGISRASLMISDG